MKGQRNKLGWENLFNLGFVGRGNIIKRINEDILSILEKSKKLIEDNWSVRDKSKKSKANPIKKK